MCPTSRAATRGKRRCAPSVAFYHCCMCRDVGLYAKALLKHWIGLVTGAAVSLALLVYGVFEKKELEPWQFLAIAGAGVVVAGFLAWREERRQVNTLASSLAAATAKAAPDPEAEFRRPR